MGHIMLAELGLSSHQVAANA